MRKKLLTLKLNTYSISEKQVASESKGMCSRVRRKSWPLRAHHHPQLSAPQEGEACPGGLGGGDGAVYVCVCVCVCCYAYVCLRVCMCMVGRLQMCTCVHLCMCVCVCAYVLGGLEGWRGGGVRVGGGGQGEGRRGNLATCSCAPRPGWTATVTSWGAAVGALAGEAGADRGWSWIEASEWCPLLRRGLPAWRPHCKPEQVQST